MEYPSIRRQEDIEEDFHGIKIKDPYRWLEDPDSEETKAFVEAQNSLTVPFIDSYPDKANMNKRLTEMWDFPKYGCPYKKGPRYFYSYNSGLQNQPVTYVQDSLDGEARVFIDPNKMSEDGTIAIQTKSFTKDGSLCAIALSAKGSDWQSVKFMDVATGNYLDDVLKKVKFSCLEWTRDNKGVFYNQYPQAEEHHEGKETDTNTNQKLYYHLLGTPQTDDVLCTEFPHQPKWMCGVQLSDDGSYLLMEIVEGCDPVNKLYYCEMEKLKDGIKGLIPWVKLIDNFEAEYDYVTNEGSLFTFKTNLKAPKYKLINIDFNKPDQSEWVDLIPEHSKDVLDIVTCVNQTDLILVYMHQVKHVMYVHDLSTGECKFTFPLDVGSIQAVTGDKDQTELFYYFTSFLLPGSIYRADMTQNPLQPAIFRDVTIPGFDADKFTTKQVFYKSKDGTEVPMFIVHKKSVTLNSDNPVYLYGYGGFNISLTPYFSVSRLLFINNFNGVYALPNIRGGGELGETWHKGGMLENKQNVFDDFIAAAEWLIHEKYTNSNKLCINGGSNGGLLVGACANQRPDLFKVVVADVGVMDMLRFHKFTIGHAWITDFGCADKKQEFEYLIKYSPLHNICEPIIGQYPATLLVTADHDDRVVPLHSFKFIAELQHKLGKCDKQTNPLMIRVETKAGHGGGKPTTKIIESLVEKTTFIALNMDLKWQD